MFFEQKCCLTYVIIALRVPVLHNVDIEIAVRIYDLFLLIHHDISCIFIMCNWSRTYKRFENFWTINANGTLYSKYHHIHGSKQ